MILYLQTHSTNTTSEAQDSELTGAVYYYKAYAG